MDDIYYALIQLIIAIVAFLLGKYVFPNLKKITDSNNEFIAALSTWVYNFVIDAKNTFDNDVEGEEKREWVYGHVSELLDKWGVVLTSEQIYALIESAYDKMLVEAPIPIEYGDPMSEDDVEENQDVDPDNTEDKLRMLIETLDPEDDE